MLRAHTQLNGSILIFPIRLGSRVSSGLASGPWCVSLWLPSVYFWIFETFQTMKGHARAIESTAKADLVCNKIFNFENRSFSRALLQLVLVMKLMIVAAVVLASFVTYNFEDCTFPCIVIAAYNLFSCSNQTVMQLHISMYLQIFINSLPSNWSQPSFFFFFYEKKLSHRINCYRWFCKKEKKKQIFGILTRSLSLILSLSTNIEKKNKIHVSLTRRRWKKCP